MKVAMKIESVMFLGSSKSSYVSKKTGKPVDIFDVAIKQGGGVGQLSTTKEVYDMYASGQIKDFAKVDLIAEYNSDFRNLQVVGVHPVK